MHIKLARKFNFLAPSFIALALFSVASTASAQTASPSASDISFSASQYEILTGGVLDVSWSAPGMVSCSALASPYTGQWDGNKEASGMQRISVSKVAMGQVYVLTCLGQRGSVSKSISVSVVSNNSSSVDATPLAGKLHLFYPGRMEISLGDSTSLSWATSRMDSCAASNVGADDPSFTYLYGKNNPDDTIEWNGPGPTTGSSVVTPKKTGLHLYYISCTDGGDVETKVTAVNVSSKPVILASGNPSQIVLGEPVSLAWSASGATSCSASTSWITPANLFGGYITDEGWHGSMPVSGSMAVSPKNKGVYRYSISCDGPGGKTSKVFAAITILDKIKTPDVRIWFEENSINAGNYLPDSYKSIALGQSAKISWAIRKPEGYSCSGIYKNLYSGTYEDDGVTYKNDSIIQGALPLSGTVTVTPTQAVYRQYYVICRDLVANKDVRSDIRLSVAGAVAIPKVSLSASRSSFSPGEATTLSWSSTDATACSAYSSPSDAFWNGPSSTGESSSSETVSTGMTASSVTFVPKVASEDSSLNWLKPIAGNQEVIPANSGLASYGIICRGPGGSAFDSVGLDVAPGALDINLTAVPGAIDLGGSSALAWSAIGADSCIASSAPTDSSWDGTKASSGTQLVVPASVGSASYSLSCQNPGSTASKSAVIAVKLADIPYVQSMAAEPVIDVFSLSAVPSVASFRFKGDKPAMSDVVTLRVNRADAVGPVTISVEGVSPALPGAVTLGDYRLGTGSSSHVLPDGQDSAQFTAILSKKIPGACASLSATGCVPYFVTFKASDSAGKSAFATVLLSGATFKPAFFEF